MDLLLIAEPTTFSSHLFTWSTLSILTPYEAGFGTCARSQILVQTNHSIFKFAGNWFGGKRPYHHTALVTVCYSMREALQIVAEEGLEATWARHLRLHKTLWKGLSELGLEPFVEDEKDRLVTVNTIKVSKLVLRKHYCKVSMKLFKSLGCIIRTHFASKSAGP